MSLAAIDLASVGVVQSALGPAAVPLAEAVTLLGGAPALLLLYLAVAWWRGVYDSLEIGALLLLAMVLVGVIKVVVMAPRPWMIDPSVMPWHPSEGFGMPSGHAASSLVFFGYWWLRVPGRLWRWVLVCLILSIAFSRVYLGVHTPVQIVMGWSLAAALLMASSSGAVHRLGVLDWRIQCTLVAAGTLMLVAHRLWQVHVLAPAVVLPEALSTTGPALREALFEPERIHQMALLGGLLIVLIVAQRARGHGWSPVATTLLTAPLATPTTDERWWTLAIGCLVLAVLAVLALEVRAVSWALFLVFLWAPPILLVGVPAAASNAAAWWSSRR